MHLAAQIGNIEILNLLLKNGAYFQYNNKELRNPYDLATNPGVRRILKGIENLFKIISSESKDSLEKKIADTNVNAKNEYGNTLLHIAVEKDNKEVVMLLLNNDADVNAKDNYGNTPLHWAASGGHEEVVELLLEKKADVNAKNKLGNTALYLAAYNGYTDLVKVLYENGSEITFKDIYHAKNTKCYLIGRKCNFDYILPSFFLMGIALSIK